MTYSSKILSALPAYAERIALEAPGLALTYDALSKAVTETEKWLLDAHVAAIMMENSPAWVAIDLACIAARKPLLPLPRFFSEKQVQHALENAGANIIFTDQPNRFKGTAKKITIAGQECYRITCSYAPRKLPTQVAKITYTSGTTDEPKGVCLTQEAMETVASALHAAITTPAAARHVCLLPLAILLENVAGVYTALLAGATICLPPILHHPEAIHTAIQKSRATSCILVPELLRMLLAIDKPLPYLTYAAVGGARIAPELLQAASFRGIPVYEGYGLSEASSVVAVNVPGAFKIGAVGKLLQHIKVKRGSDGEIFLRNPLFSGYLGETAPQDEWFATGDIGRIDEDGFLFIQGRKKNIYITSYGRNISPEWVESLLTAHPTILQAVVYGEAKPFSVAIVVSHYPQAVRAAIAEINSRLPDYARIGVPIIVKQPFSPSNGQLTGNGRPRRQAIYDYYADEIEACYPREIAL